MSYFTSRTAVLLLWWASAGCAGAPPAPPVAASEAAARPAAAGDPEPTRTTLELAGDAIEGGLLVPESAPPVPAPTPAQQELLDRAEQFFLAGDVAAARQAYQGIADTADESERALRRAAADEVASASVYDVPGFDWSEPATGFADPPFAVPTGGGFQFQCDWYNTSGSVLTFGSSADDELCFFWAYYYPSHGAKICVHTQASGSPVDVCCPGDSLCAGLGL
ncbi:MAG: hypothetical protein HY905_22500 [Deltaproteobacteria bacterium]|nr:hypothetical protein [Deltaproteobacteria bacterium]